jgi:hypothetical protein
LTYYYENQDKVNEQIKRGLEESEELATIVLTRSSAASWVI